MHLRGNEDELPMYEGFVSIVTWILIYCGWLRGGNMENLLEM